jgi:hypothetical protein
MEKTKNYELFLKHDSNRELVENNVTKIMKSMETRNLLEFRPILVNEKMQIIDGQHRLEAAKRLGIEVYYQIMKKPPAETMLLLNTNQKRWTTNDYLNYFCEESNGQYMDLKKFMEEEGLTLPLALRLLSNRSSSRTLVHFKQGNLNFEENAFTNAKILLGDCEEIKYFIKSKMLGRTEFLESQKFKIAIIHFLKIPGVSKELFLQKLDKRLELIRPCVSIDAFLDIFVSIYNYRNPNPVYQDEVYEEKE